MAEKDDNLPGIGWGFGKRPERTTVSSILDSRSMDELWKREQALAEEEKLNPKPRPDADLDEW